MYTERYLFECEICNSACSFLDRRLSTKQGMEVVFSLLILWPCVHICMPTANRQCLTQEFCFACCLLT